MIPAAPAQPAVNPAALFGPAVTGGQPVISAQALPVNIVPPVNEALQTQNNLRNPGFIEQNTPIQRPAPRTGLPEQNQSPAVANFSPSVPPPSPFFLVQLMAQSTEFGFEVRSRASDFAQLQEVFQQTQLPEQPPEQAETPAQQTPAQAAPLAQEPVNAEITFSVERALQAFADAEALIPVDLEFDPLPNLAEELPSDGVELVV